jgi:hypothetical protein
MDNPVIHVQLSKTGVDAFTFVEFAFASHQIVALKAHDMVVLAHPLGLFIFVVSNYYNFFKEKLVVGDGMDQKI